MQKRDSFTFVPVAADQDRPGIAKGMAYGASTVNTSADAGITFRQDRGKPYYRGGLPIKVVPQFKGQRIAMQSTNSAALPMTNTGSIATFPTSPKTNYTSTQVFKGGKIQTTL